jgi:hypothetical protein
VTGGGCRVESADEREMGMGETWEYRYRGRPVRDLGRMMLEKKPLA